MLPFLSNTETKTAQAWEMKQGKNGPRDRAMSVPEKESSVISKMGKSCWLDVETEKRDEKAMEAGVQKSKAFIDIVTDDGKNSYFSREFCRKEG
eukprot:g311.t1